MPLNIMVVITMMLIGFTSRAFGQIDTGATTAELRAKYGRPLSRETFIPRRGVEMIVDYDGNGHVCKIQLPAMAPAREPGVQSTTAMDDFITEMIPLQVRGNELRRWFSVSGLSGASIIEYETVVITEGMRGQTRTGVTVSMKRPECLSESQSDTRTSK